VPRAIIVATGDLASLPVEAQDVANILSGDGYAVRLVLGPDATRAGLQRAAGEGACDLAWVGCHAGPDGFALSDGAIGAAELGVWLAQARARECVLNACYSLEHVAAIQRAAPDVGVACTIDPSGVDDRQAWTTGVYVARGWVATCDMATAVSGASGNGSLQYRYIPAPGRGGGRGAGGRMSNEDQELLRSLVNAIKGDGYTGLGLIRQWQQLSDSLASYVEEQEKWRAEQARVNQEHADRLRSLEGNKPMAVTERSVYIAVIVVALLAALLLGGVLALNGVI
jgi:hypothetical protein